MIERSFYICAHSRTYCFVFNVMVDALAPSSKLRWTWNCHSFTRKNFVFLGFPICTCFTHVSNPGSFENQETLQHLPNESSMIYLRSNRFGGFDTCRKPPQDPVLYIRFLPFWHGRISTHCHRHAMKS